jgi:hypothetical protein
VFEAKQAEHRADCRRRLEATHLSMKAILKEIYQNFKCVEGGPAA